MTVEHIAFFGTISKGTPRNDVLLKGLNKKKVRVDIINVPRLLNSRGQEIKNSFLPIFLAELLVQNVLVLLFGILNISRLYKSEIIYVPSYGNFIIPAVKVLALIVQNPLVLDSHGSVYYTQVVGRGYFPEKSTRARMYWRLDRLSINLVDKYIVFSHAMAEKFADVFDTNEQNFQVVYTGSLPPKNSQKSRTANSIDLLYWGSFIPFHGVKKIVESLSLIKDQQGTVPRSVFIGTGEVREQCQQMSKRNTLNCKFPGYVSEEKLEQSIKSATVSLGVFGDNEYMDLCLTNKVCEAAARGKPILTKRTPAIQEVFESNKSICLTDPESSERIATDMQSLLQDKKMQKKLQENSRETYNKYLTPTAVAGQFLSAVDS